MARNPPLATADANILLPFEPIPYNQPTFSASLENHAGSVCAYDEAERLIMQHDFMRLSFPQDGLQEFMKTLVVALRTIGKAERGGEGGIRTHGALRLNGFRDRLLRPLGHLSGVYVNASSDWPEAICSQRVRRNQHFRAEAKPQTLKAKHCAAFGDGGCVA